MNNNNSKNNGGSTDYYDIPEGAKTLNDLMEHKEMLHGVGDAFKALYRLHDKDTPERNLNKVIYYAQRELDRLDRLNKLNTEK